MNDYVTCDSEWGYRDGRVGAETAWEPVVFVVRVDGVSHHFAARDDRLPAFVEAHRDRTWVAHSAPAEMRYLMRLGITPPPRWWCTQVGYRAFTNRSGYLESSLVEALRELGLHRLIPPAKEETRDQILHLRFNPNDMPAIIRYCEADTLATEAVYLRLVNHVKPIWMSYWTEYLKVVAKVEQRGIKIDTNILDRILRYRHHLQDAIREEVNGTVRVFRHDGSFCREAFFAWVDRLKIRWPVVENEQGRWVRSMDDDTLEMMEGRHPFITKFRQMRKSIQSLQAISMIVDAENQRHYYGMMPFRSVTGRNQPSGFIFGAPRWMRHLIVPDRGKVLCYADFKAEEIGVAAALSRDPVMWERYLLDDPHIGYAISAGAAPPGATKKTHPLIRAIYKIAGLAILYAQGAEGIALRLGIEIEDARALLRQHQELYRVYHEWSSRVTNAAFHRRYATTRQGWRAKVTPDTRWRTWSNYPVQAGAGEIMRCMTIALDRLGVETLGVVHDAWLLQCPIGEEKRTHELVATASRWACEKVLGGEYQLKFDWRVYPERFQEDDESVEEAWQFILSKLPKGVLRVESE